jgi:hypothetical protein
MEKMAAKHDAAPPVAPRSNLTATSEVSQDGLLDSTILTNPNKLSVSTSTESFVPYRGEVGPDIVSYEDGPSSSQEAKSE